MAVSPWDRAKSGTEHGEQSALFIWCNMAARFGLDAANDERSYKIAEHANAVHYAAAEASVSVLRSMDELEAAEQAIRQPSLSRLYAIHNQGHGDKIRGANAKAEGVKAGVPDVYMPEPRPLNLTILQWLNKERAPCERLGVVAGLYIELKRAKSSRGAKGSTSDAQDDWITYLRGQGYAVAVCVGWEEARDVLLAYLGLTGR